MSTIVVIYSYLDKENPSAPNGKILKQATVGLDMKIRLPGKTITKADFLPSSKSSDEAVSSLMGSQLSLALDKLLQVREVFVNLDGRRMKENEIVLRITLGK